MFYLILIGNKFSTVFVSWCFFLLPYGIFYLKSSTRGYPLLELPTRSTFHKFELCIGAACFVGLIGYALYNTLFVLRVLDVDTAVSFARHRIFVQQAQLWWTAYERVVLNSDYDIFHAFMRVFIDPIKSGNTSLYFLMFKDLGPYINQILATGGHYTGAYPTILLELLGPAWSVAAAFVMGYLMGRLTVMLYGEILNARFLSAISLLFLLLPFIMFHLGGRLSFLFQWTYLIKIVLTICVMLLERTTVTTRPKGNGILAAWPARRMIERPKVLGET